MKTLAPFSSRDFRLARRLSAVIAEDGSFRTVSGRFDLTSEQKKQARHLARDGATIAQIRDALGLACSDQCLNRKLREINIRTFRSFRLTSPECGE